MSTPWNVGKSEMGNHRVLVFSQLDHEYSYFPGYNSRLQIVIVTRYEKTDHLLQLFKTHRSS